MGPKERLISENTESLSAIHVTSPASGPQRASRRATGCLTTASPAPKISTTSHASPVIAGDGTSPGEAVSAGATMPAMEPHCDCSILWVPLFYQQ